MNTKSSKVLARAGNAERIFLALHELTLEADGKERPYYMVTRGDKIVPAADKRPDAVVIVALHMDRGYKRLVLTSEYRPAIGVRELSFPAGIIDAKDYGSEPADIRHGALTAAKREFAEETGLTLIPTKVSPHNLYSSAGMTNESAAIVIGEARGVPTTANAEADEDIKIKLLALPEIITMVSSPGDIVFSKVAWPFLWAFSQFESLNII